MKKNRLFFYRTRFKGMAVAPIMLLLLPVMNSCGKSGDYSFKNPDDAINCYRSFHSKMKDISHTNTTEFSSVVNQWRELNDTVRNFLLKDSILLKDMAVSEKYTKVRDSVRTQMFRLAESWRYGYGDVIKIKEQTSPFMDDEFLRAAVRKHEPFFSSLNDVQVLRTDKSKMLQQYRLFLQEAKQKGISNREELLDYIKQEDYCFRAFLSHLHEMGDESVSDITKLTEEVCEGIFSSASQGKIDAQDAIVIMSMRTVRRIVQNSLQCIDNMNQKSMVNSVQANAYLWMIIQPFIAIDKLSIATMTEKEKSRLREIVDKLPKSKRFAEAFETDLKSLNYLLPQQLLKIYLLSF